MTTDISAVATKVFSADEVAEVYYTWMQLDRAAQLAGPDEGKGFRYRADAMAELYLELVEQTRPLFAGPGALLKHHEVDVLTNEDYLYGGPLVK